ncbi:M15 family metallopeptidase [Ichthyenterobacterium sp. W332]|uniref:D-alanyl-D-alanine dipeptidase n=1 Tax=Microcosmobacter mediterraneus TaxID=3075607 RepID=A0ABU2YM89_9FLAO|nr:M15 family metallopeptidase [Ichthyenterobacterium sp. W332]MDT0559279.1 M15 family metallopeptidase [Ichthyenterobacterium sp. W332]
MKYIKVFSLCLLVLSILSYNQNKLPDGFVYAKSMIKDLDVELRYYSTNNFVGDTITGYKSNRLILTEPTVEALQNVQNELQNLGYCLKVFDGYRPQRAVNHFIRWAKDLNDTINKSRFYPEVEKRHLFKEEYIATRSGHSRGSTIDLTIIDGNTEEELDMGSAYDFFGEQSWVNYQNISETQKQNRQLLQRVMLKYGFRNYSKEWWHFTLRGEPFPKTYFDFEVE